MGQGERRQPHLKMLRFLLTAHGFAASLAIRESGQSIRRSRHEEDRRQPLQC